MKKLIISGLLLSSVSNSTALYAQDGLALLDALALSGEIRPRYEYADKIGGAIAANAFTARTRLAVKGKLFSSNFLSAKIGITTVNNFGFEDYNDGSTSGNTTYEKVVDAQQAMLSEAYLSYKSTNTSLLFGRSHINLDDQRFIGTVGWRQMERAYDSATVVNTSIKNFTLLASWIYGYQGVNSKPTTQTSSIIVNLHYKIANLVSLTAFSYLLADVHDTYGFRIKGKQEFKTLELSYVISYAEQLKASIDFNSQKNTNINANYIDLVLNTNISGFITGIEYERLSKANGSSTKGFTTPLATLHKFQGFSDEFLSQTASANNNGLKDMSLKVGYKTNKFGKALIIYHKFFAQTGVSKDLGSEIDALYATKIKHFKALNALLKVASYSSGAKSLGHDQDNLKFWAQLDYKF